MTAQPAPTWIGVQLGSYRIRDLIGEGGMGQVYRAYHVSTDRPAAIKVLFAGASQDAETLDRFRREAAILKEVQHPALVRILDSGNHESVPYVAFDLVEGRLLAGLLREHHRFAPPRALDIAAQIADGLAQMHARHVVHRDLKPENVMIRGDDQPCILDFGIAKHFGSAARTMDQVTQAGNLLGTLYYMPPELASAELSPAYDVWALGVMLYEMVAGRRPFAESEDLGVGEYFAALRAGRYPKLSTLVPGGGAKLDGLIAGMLQADPDKRIKDGAQAADAIRQVAVELGSAAGAIDATKARPAAVVPEQGGGARPQRTVAVDGAAVSADGRRPSAGVSAKGSAPAMEFAKTPLTSQGLWERRAGYAMTLGGVALLTAGVAGGIYQKRLAYTDSIAGGPAAAAATPSPSGSTATQPTVARLREMGQHLKKRLEARAASLNYEWLKRFASAHKKQLKADKPAVATALRKHFEDLGILAPLNEFLAMTPRYFEEEAIPERERWEVRSALCDVELVEYFCDTHSLPGVLVPSVRSLSSLSNNSPEPWRLHLDRAASWIRSSRGEERYSPGKVQVDEWTLSGIQGNDRVLLWYAAFRWAKGLLLDVSVGQGWRRLLVANPPDGIAPSVRLKAITWEVHSEQKLERNIVIDTLGPDSLDVPRSYLCAWLPPSLSGDRLSVRYKIIEVPLSPQPMEEPALVDRIISVCRGGMPTEVRPSQMDRP